MAYKNLADLIRVNAELRPDKQYLFFNDKVYTYKEAYETIIRIASIMSNNGVKKGDRVVVFLGNSPEYIFSYMATVMLGAVVIPTNSFLKSEELSYNMNDCEASYIITANIFAPVINEMINLVPSLKQIFSFSDTDFNSINLYTTSSDVSVKDFDDVHTDDVAALIYSSGTTGRPKGIILTHKNILSNTKSATEAVKVVENDRFLLVLPMFHAFTFVGSVLMPLYKGGSTVILESILETGKESYKTLLQTLKPTILLGVPQLFASMTRKKILEEMPFRLYISGAAPMPLEVLTAFAKIYNAPLIEGYGLSEASPAVSFNPLHKQKPGTIGIPLPDVEVKIVDEEGNTLDKNQVGEICAKGSNVMKGYWNQPEETEKVLKPDGWLHTGDVGFIDDDGFITIVDRIKDLIIVKGMNVYPREIEEVLYKYPGVQTAAVIGIPHAEGSDKIIAYIKVDPETPTTEMQIKAFVKNKLANFKIPKVFILTDNIPINLNGKILKRVLRELAMETFGPKLSLEGGF